MPLLLCPNDNGPMQTVQRAGVEFDMCPTCRGVWLDRGELEKLMAKAHEDITADPALQGAASQSGGFLSHARSRPPHQQDWHDRDDDRRYKKRRSSLFDIFD